MTATISLRTSPDNDKVSGRLTKQVAWENERPDVAMKTLDFISRKTGTAPTLVAITAEP